MMQTPVFHFDAFGADSGTADDVAERLEFIAEQIRRGVTSGDADGAGWWSVTDLAEDGDSDDGDDD